MDGYCFVHKRYSNMVKTILTVVIVTVEGAYMSICKSLGPKKSSQYCMDFWIIRARGRDYRVNFPFFISWSSMLQFLFTLFTVGNLESSLQYELLHSLKLKTGYGILTGYSKRTKRPLISCDSKSFCHSWKSWRGCRKGKVLN